MIRALVVLAIAISAAPAAADDPTSCPVGPRCAVCLVEAGEIVGCAPPPPCVLNGVYTCLFENGAPVSCVPRCRDGRRLSKPKPCRLCLTYVAGEPEPVECPPAPEEVSR